MKKIVITAAILLTLVISAFREVPQISTPPAPVAIQWMTFEEAVEKSRTEKRKIFIDVYTDWCGYCKMMDRNTFSDEKIATLLNEKFYAVKLDAEQKDPITFRGTTFKYVASGRGGYHELAASLLNNQLSYPNFVFLTEDFKIVPVMPGKPSLPGYRKPEEFHLFLSYVADERYSEMQIADYQKVYKSPYASAENGKM